MPQENDTIKSVEVEIAPEDSMNIIESFQYASEQLRNLRERMEKSDRELYHAVGEFVDSTNQTIQNLAAEALDQTIAPDLPSLIESSSNEMEQLQKRYQLLRSEINTLLLTTYTNEEIDRLRNLNYLTSLILGRIQELSVTQTNLEQNKTFKKVSIEELKLQFSSLKEARVSYNIKAKSWQDLADKLNAKLN
jgi:hypothetical protein